MFPDGVRTVTHRVLLLAPILSVMSGQVRQAPADWRTDHDGEPLQRFAELLRQLQ
jgi:hypothetical protein